MGPHGYQIFTMNLSCALGNIATEDNTSVFASCAASQLIGEGRIQEATSQPFDSVIYGMFSQPGVQGEPEPYN